MSYTPPVKSWSYQATVDFGATEVPDVQATIPWPAGALGTHLIAAPVGGTTADHDPDDLLAEGVTAVVTNVIPGTSFDIFATAPYGTWGQYLVNVIGA